MLKNEDIKVAFYLEKILDHLKAVATLDGQEVHTLATKFVLILNKVKIWFQRQGKQLRPASEEKEPVAGFEPARPPESNQEDPQTYADKFSFLTDFNKPPTVYPTVWPNQFQSPNDYSDPNYPLQSPWNDVAFDFPMDLDPNLMTHLVHSDQSQDYQEHEPSNMEAYNQVDYLNNMSNFGGWPLQ